MTLIMMMVVSSSFFQGGHTIKSSLSGEGCDWFDVGVSPYASILDVVLIGLASSQSHHSHLSGV